VVLRNSDSGEEVGVVQGGFQSEACGVCVHLGEIGREVGAATSEKKLGLLESLGGNRLNGGTFTHET
jgi:hypothetical protein